MMLARPLVPLFLAPRMVAVTTTAALGAKSGVAPVIHRRTTSLRSKAGDKESAGSAASPASSPEVDPTIKLATWQYGKTIQDKDLPSAYLGLMFIPFFMLMLLPLLANIGSPPMPMP
ncbi:hypothetical protein FOA52_008757 [Chlamydomonas sp. UWO 241]|nr:hypothetical protein FOA52_008757 [Chlamydomonas sp. UWO 241]